MPLCVSYSGILHWMHSFNNLRKCCFLKFIFIQLSESMLSEMSYNICGKFRSRIVPCCRRTFLTPGSPWMGPLLPLVSMQGGRWELNSWRMAGNRSNHYNNLCVPSLKRFGHFPTQMSRMSVFWLFICQILDHSYHGTIPLIRKTKRDFLLHSSLSLLHLWTRVLGHRQFPLTRSLSLFCIDVSAYSTRIYYLHVIILFSLF